MEKGVVNMKCWTCGKTMKEIRMSITNGNPDITYICPDNHVQTVGISVSMFGKLRDRIINDFHRFIGGEPRCPACKKKFQLIKIMYAEREKTVITFIALRSAG